MKKKLGILFLALLVVGCEKPEINVKEFNENETKYFNMLINHSHNEYDCNEVVKEKYLKMQINVKQEIKKLEEHVKQKKKYQTKYDLLDYIKYSEEEMKGIIHSLVENEASKECKKVENGKKEVKKKITNMKNKITNINKN